jgi:hypothetical protein
MGTPSFWGSASKAFSSEAVNGSNFNDNRFGQVPQGHFFAINRTN